MTEPQSAEAMPGAARSADLLRSTLADLGANR
jgi:hypothetical protein